MIRTATWLKINSDSALTGCMVMASVLPVREQATSQRTTGEQTRSLKYRGRHDDPGPAKERKPPGEGPRAAPQRRHIVDQTRPPGFTLGSLGRPPRPRLRPAYGTHHRIVAQPGHSACSGCKRSPVRIRPVRPIFEPFDLGYSNPLGHRPAAPR